MILIKMIPICSAVCQNLDQKLMQITCIYFDSKMVSESTLEHLFFKIFLGVSMYALHPDCASHNGTYFLTP